MNFRIINKIGVRHKRLTVVSLNERRDSNGSVYWNCKCDCGEIVVIRTNMIGITASCKKCKANDFKIRITKHGLNDHPIYLLWQSMKQRCYYKKHGGYKMYGGRGITICEEWRKNFLSFYNWCVTNGYASKLQIDRIDNNKGYSPSNCRFISSIENAYNKRNTTYVTIDNKRYTILELSRDSGIPTSIIYSRIHYLKWDANRAITTQYKPNRDNKKYIKTTFKK